MDTIKEVLIYLLENEKKKQGYLHTHLMKNCKACKDIERLLKEVKNL